jgi:hypothetical protein
MWQEKEGMCESLFGDCMWGWAFDVEGHVSKTIWKAMLTDGLHKCGVHQADCGEQRGSKDELAPVLEAMGRYAREKGDAANMHGFARLQGASNCSSSRDTSRHLFGRERLYCHWTSTEGE